MPKAEPTVDLPPRPDPLVSAEVAVWRAPLLLETFAPATPDRFPAYLDRRVYQGSSGRVYPLPFHHQIERRSRPRAWDAVHLENDWVRVTVLPELGGRVHAFRDLTSGHDVFYANPVVKPALVGLAGPWIAGGVEFNWPQHHRPATYLPTDVEIVSEPDGAVTVWCSDHDPFTRMKGMHGVRLRPDSAVLELSVRLFNRSELTQSFLWWANVAARVDGDYESFFPHDVTMVADHARRAVTSFPRSDRSYYGVDYPARAGRLHSASDGTVVTGDRIDWYHNIPVPTSYMCLGSREDFFGGYDHASQIGFVHVADHHIAVGKKQWTWGNAAFGHAWDANLSTDGAHYVELMAGVYTDNQPDFAYIAPGETKVFTQAWYPIRETGPVDRATREAAVRLRRDGDRLTVGALVTRTRRDVHVEVSGPDGRLHHDVVDLDPGHRYGAGLTVPADHGPVTVTVRQGDRTLVRWTEPQETAVPLTLRPAEEPPAPQEVGSVEELSLIATHLELYRHATRSPVPYWQAALERDPRHVDSLLGLARRAYEAARLDEARTCLEHAIARLTERHRSPRDTTALYLLGLVHEAQGRDDDAADAYGRALWSRASRAPAGYRMACIEARAGRDREALDRLTDVLRAEPEHLRARALAVICHRRLATVEPDTAHARRAEQLLRSALELDPLDAWLRFLAGREPSRDAQTCLDVALELAEVGEPTAALEVLELARRRDAVRPAGQTAVGPLVAYHRAAVLDRAGLSDQAAAARRQGRQDDPTWCFPGRLTDALVLQEAVRVDPGDSRARALLGHWYYAVGRRSDAARAWREAAALDPGDAVVWRNLGLVAVNQDHDPAAARDAYHRARRLSPDDARLLYEQDQLAAVQGVDPHRRLAELEARRDLVDSRDDLTVELLHLLITVGRSTEAIEMLLTRRFQPWEGGEGQVLGAWERALTRIATEALAQGRATDAVQALNRALEVPDTLGESRHLLADTTALRVLLGLALDRTGSDEASSHWAEAAEQDQDPLETQDPSPGESTFWAVLALRRLDRTHRAARLTQGLRVLRHRYASTEPEVDYFATSLPDLLLFDIDPLVARDAQLAVLDARIAILEGDLPTALRGLEHPALRSVRHAVDLRHTVRQLGPELFAPLARPRDAGAPSQESFA